MDDLPIELLTYITGFLDDKSTRMLRSTNANYLFNWIRIKNFTIYNAEPSPFTFPDIVDSFLKYPYNIRLRFEKIQGAQYNETYVMLKELARLTNLEDLAIPEYQTYSRYECYTNIGFLTTLTKLQWLQFPAKVETLIKFPNLTRLDLDMEEDVKNIKKIIRTYSQLQHIVWQYESLDIVSLHPNPKMLTALEMLHLAEYPYSLSQLVNLKYLHIRFVLQGGSTGDRDEKNNRQDFIFGGLYNLERLILGAESYPRFDSLTRLTYLQAVNESTVPFNDENFASWTALKNLRYLEMEECNVEEDAELYFFTALTSLERLNIDLYEGHHLKFINRKTLTRLRIYLADGVNFKKMGEPFKYLQNLTLAVEKDFLEQFDDCPLLASNKLTRLNFSHTDTTNLVPPCIGQLTTLKRLEIKETSHTANNADVIFDFSTMSNLKKLTDLERLEVTGYHNVVLTLTNLTRLVIKTNDDHGLDLNYEDLTDIKNLSKLQHLELWFDVPDEVFLGIGTLTHLTYLSVPNLTFENKKLLTNLINLKRMKTKVWNSFEETIGGIKILTCDHCNGDLGESKTACDVCARPVCAYCIRKPKCCLEEENAVEKINDHSVDNDSKSQDENIEIVYQADEYKKSNTNDNNDELERIALVNENNQLKAKIEELTAQNRELTVKYASSQRQIEELKKAIEFFTLDTKPMDIIIEGDL